jgi:hypothetical protein
MTTDSSRRQDLYEHARGSWGTKTAETLMDYLPPDRDQLATQTDIRLLKADVTVLGAELRGEMAALGGDLRSEMAVTKDIILSKMSEQHRTQMMGMLTLMAGLVLAFAGMLVTLAVS